MLGQQGLSLLQSLEGRCPRPPATAHLCAHLPWPRFQFTACSFPVSTPLCSSPSPDSRDVISVRRRRRPLRLSARQGPGKQSDLAAARSRSGLAEPTALRGRPVSPLRCTGSFAWFYGAADPGFRAHLLGNKAPGLRPQEERLNSVPGEVGTPAPPLCPQSRPQEGAGAPDRRLEQPRPRP